jgi:hypothetical protein
MQNLSTATCQECDAKPGELHQLGCDVECCSRCGHQLLLCEHSLGSEKPPPDNERMPWSGEWPGVAECREFGWYAKINRAGPGWVTCAPDDEEAIPDLNRLRSDAVWDRQRKRFVRKRDQVQAADKNFDGQEQESAEGETGSPADLTADSEAQT